MESSDRFNVKRFEYRNCSYDLSLTSRNNVYVRVFPGGGEDPLEVETFRRRTDSHRSAKRAVRAAHRWAKVYIDQRLSVINAIEEVEPSCM